MKLSVLFISSILTLVTATPLVLSRAPSHPFKLLADGVNLPETLFPPLQVEGDTGTGFFRFGWFNLGGHEPDLFFPEDFSIAGTVLDDRKNGFEMSISSVPAGHLYLANSIPVSSYQSSSQANRMCTSCYLPTPTAPQSSLRGTSSLPAAISYTNPTSSHWGTGLSVKRHPTKSRCSCMFSSITVRSIGC